MSENSLRLKQPASGWRPTTLGEICDRVQDATTPISSGRRLYLGLEHLASGIPALVGRGVESDVTSGKTAFQQSDVLFGKLRPYLRKSVLAPDRGICSTDILAFRAKSTTDPAYLCLLTHTNEFIAHANATTSGVQHPRTSWAGLREFRLHAPPHPEQQKIAGVLGLVQRAMEQQERLLALTAELKKNLLHQLFTRGLHREPQKQADIGPVPKSWEVVTLGSLATIISKGSSPKWQGFQYVDEGVLFVRSQNVGEGRMDFSNRAFLPPAFNEKEKRSILKNEDILINLVGASIGRAALATPEVEGANCNQAVGFVRIEGPRALKEIIVSFLLSPVGQQQMFFQKKDIARANLSLLDLRSFKVPRPSAAEIQQIADAFSTLEAKLDLHRRKHAALTALFRTLLHQLMTAQVRVHDLDLDRLLARARK